MRQLRAFPILRFAFRVAAVIMEAGHPPPCDHRTPRSPLYSGHLPLLLGCTPSPTSHVGYVALVSSYATPSIMLSRTALRTVCRQVPHTAATVSYAPFASFSTSSSSIRKTTALKRMLQSPQLEFLMEAHNGLSAKIVEESGFKGIWGSGLSISAAMGVRDSNEASYTQVLEVLEFMSDVTTIPILLDADTGYGNFNNARILTRKLEQRGIAGACIEDKLFPKSNSLLGNTESKPLASIEEFSMKIRAMKDAQKDPDFVVVARVEAFIAGWGLEEALKRSEAYMAAGADAILMHSKRSDHSEIEAFMKEWKGRHPVIIVPTKYYQTPTATFKEWGVSSVIWANHNMRSCITAMQQTTKKIFNDQSLVNVEPNIASVKEVFRLQGQPELDAAEKKYLPKIKLPNQKEMA